ncbi:MAG TPA: MFS transporter [Thermoleophilaceae bacterium]|nr:MFS transporter [Thermoleophilaceae bacterium]
MKTSQRITLAVVSIATAMLMLDIAVVNTAIPSIARDLDADLSGVQWVVDAYTLALASVVLTAGSLADRLGRRRLFAIGLGIFTVASLASALADSIAVLNTARAVQGIGGAIMFAVSLALLAHAFPRPRERAGALAVYGATIGASFAVGPLVGGALTSGLDWRWIFLVNIPIGLIALAATFHGVEESRDPNARSIDWLGQIVLGGGLFLLVLGLLRGNGDGWTSTPIVAELAGAVALLALFVVIERRVREPMLPLGHFRIRAFTGAQVAAFAISGSFFAVYLYATLYLQNVLGMSAVDAGLAYLPGTVVMFFVSGASAQLLERVRPAALIGGGLVLVSAGMLLMSFMVGTDSSWTVTLPGMLMASVGTGLFNPAVSGVALNSLPDEQSGLAAGVNDTFRQAGIAVGIAGLGALIPAKAALGQDPAAYVDGLQSALAVGAALAAIGAIVATHLLRRVRAADTLASGGGAVEVAPAAA